jgi:mono/diheme cytochrome c family protein
MTLTVPPVTFRPPVIKPPGASSPYMNARVIAVMMLAVCSLWAASVRSAPADGEAICPLPEADVKKAVSQFGSLYQVFQDRRCVNCHGAVNPFAKGGGHPGGDINLDHILKGLQGDPHALTEQLSQGLAAGQAPSAAAVSNAQAAIRTYFSAEPPLSDPQTIADVLSEGGLEGVYRQACAECHTHSPAPWQLATSRFAGQSATALCESFQKRMDPSDFLGHVTADNLGFIQTGFQGSRALNPFGQAFYTTEMKRPYGLEPVQAMGADAFIKAANEWIDALGASFHKPASCGCSETHYQLNVKINYKFHDVQGKKAEADAASSQSFSADMKFTQADTFSAEAHVPFKMAIQTGMPGSPAGKAAAPNGVPPGMPPGMAGMAGSPIQCTSELNSTDTWHITGKIQNAMEKGKSYANTVKVSARITKEKKAAEVVCVAYGRTMHVPGPPAATEEDSTEGYDMIMPAVVGKTEKFNFNTPSGKMEVELGMVQSSR